MRLQPLFHCAREEIDIHTDVSEIDGCGRWAIFVLGPTVSPRGPHIKPDLVSHLVSVETLG